MKRSTAPIFTGIIVVAVFTAGIALYAGLLTGHLWQFQGLSEAAEALRALPMRIQIPGEEGYWEAEKDRELSDDSVAMLRIQNAYVLRTYRNSITQEFVNFTVMVGPAGKITVHTPEVCFGGKNYEKEATRTSVPFDVVLEDKEQVDTFWRTNFIGRSLDTNNRVSFYYAVSTGDVWQAVEHPRSHFQRYRYVYRIQVEAYSGAEDERDVVKSFLDDCLPVIHEHLRPCK